jgi:hypothetical protein
MICTVLEFDPDSGSISQRYGSRDPEPFLRRVIGSLISGSQGADPTSLSSTREKAGRNNLKEKITPLLPTGIGEQYSQNHIQFRTCSALALM